MQWWTPALVASALVVSACSFDESGIGSLSDGGGSPDGPANDSLVLVDDARVTDADPSVDAPLPIADAAVPDAPVPDARVPDAMVPDAPVDAPIVYNVVELMTVSCDGTTETSTTVLSLGTTYKLRASGTCQVGTGGGGVPIMCDAEYYDFNDPKDTFGTMNPIDRGVAINDDVVDIVGPPDWGSYALGHVYEVDFVGLDSTITATFYDSVYSNNSGSITVEILAPN